MTDQERERLMERLKSSIEEAKRMTPEEARAKLRQMHPDMWDENGSLMPEWGGEQK